MRRWNHNVILFRGISRFLSAVCRRWFPGQSGDRTCLVLYKRLVICFARPFQQLPSACTDIPLTLSWNFSGKFLFNSNPSFLRELWLHTHGYPSTSCFNLGTLFYSTSAEVHWKSYRLPWFIPGMASLQQTSAPPCGALDRFALIRFGKTRNKMKSLNFALLVFYLSEKVVVRQQPFLISRKLARQNSMKNGRI